MSEAIATFQSQLSGVMETVFKAAMFEITRLVEDSFLEEVTRCRDQVESMKKRLKWSESRRKGRGGERSGRCLDCGVSSEEEHSTTEKNLKQEKVLQEEMNTSHSADGETPGNEVEGAFSPVKASETQGSQGDKLDILLKEEDLRITPETNESQERWGVSLEETEADLPGPSKQYSDPRTPKCHVNWEAGFDQKSESAQAGPSGDSSGSLYQGRYGMKDMGGFNKTEYGDGNMLDMGNLDGFKGSPSHLGDSLSYMGHFPGDVEASERIGHQAYQDGNLRNRKGAACSTAGSSSETNVDVGGEFNCMLINEEGYLQDLNILYPEHTSGESGGRLSLRSQAVPNDRSLDSTMNMYGPSGAYSDTLNLGERSQQQVGTRTGRRKACNQYTSFSDSAQPKVQKQSQKGVGQGPPYSCPQCGKNFTQASSLKAHQRIHSGQGPQVCSHCGKGFPSSSDLKAHKCDQTGDKPYCCTLCGNKFGRLWNLKLHQRIHTQEKPHRCTMCDKSFTRADILKIHQRTHTGERPYCCPVCGLGFKRLDHLKLHQRKHGTNL